ncbi:MAG: hypothetical protein HYT46_02350 [Candidatus Vogelbacteria bacterium]|nr:hypothetical protein [Candidatus Vogelbacteria bacterium]
MTTVTISKKITKGEELVVIPREEYERFKEIETFFSREREADNDIAFGRLSRSYRTRKDLKKALDLLKR